MTTPRSVPQAMCCVLLASCFAISAGLLGSEKAAVFSGLTVHEWGTFTLIAGDSGQAVSWAPLTGNTDLPGFVEHFRDPGFKLGLRGTVRMETPVLYFYDQREETVSVKVNFAKGLITEWYPRASRVEPKEVVSAAAPYGKQADGSIAWDAVTLTPQSRAEFPHERRDSSYYAARMTSATPLRVKTAGGDQQEKFLFYRGVAAFAVPLSARLIGENQVLIENHGEEKIPGVILFERRGDRVGYRMGGAVDDKTLMDAPELTGSVTALGRELEGMLVAQGLYQDEAHAMVETWRSSWFEEGSRLLYIVPGEFVNNVLPLTIRPAPAQTVRVFVGRLELVTPATEKEVERALATHDGAALGKYGRFLEPVLETMMKKGPDARHARQIQEALNACYSAQIARNAARN
ncbi:MAG TPA: hypothetical protein VFN26_15715 [Candidatus Acidoferrum sp.]|nr:hypothetical protein [Candidatus Acidoferrum sp.]